MDERRWAERLAADLAEGHSSLSKARIQQLPGDYRRTLALGLRLKASNFSTENRSKESTLKVLLKYMDHPKRNRRASLLRRIGRFAIATVVIVAAGILFIALPDIFPIPPSSQPSSSEGQISTHAAISNHLPEMAMRALNRALEVESGQTPPSYDPDERIPTRIMELDEVLLHEVMPPDRIAEYGLDPSSPVWVVRLTGYWLVPPPPDPVPEAFYEFQRDNHYKYIEVLLDARTGEQVGGVIGFNLPEGIEPGFATETTSPALAAEEVNADVVDALNLALEVVGWFPPSRSEALENQPTRVEQVSLLLPTDPRLSGLGNETSNPVWLVVLQGAWQHPYWLQEPGVQPTMASGGAAVKTIRVFIDAISGERLAWDATQSTNRSGSSIFPSPGGRWIATFDPSGSRLQIAGQNGLFNLAMPAGRALSDASWSPDEATLVAALADGAGADPPEIWITREHKGVFEVFEPAVQPSGLTGGMKLQFDMWSPDGQYLLFWVGPASASIAADGLGLWSLKVDAGQPSRLSTDALLNPDYRSWAPGGEQLIFTDGGYRSALVNKRLTLVNLDTGDEQVLVSEDRQVTGAVAWSPGGDLIAYAAVQADQTSQAGVDDMSWDNPAILARRIYLLDPKSGVYQRLNEVEDYQDAPRWSANGEVLYFVQIDGQEAQVMVADPATGQARTKSGCRAPLPETAGYYGQVDWSELYLECFPSVEPATEPTFDFGSVIPWSEVVFFRPTETDQIERGQLQTGVDADCGLNLEEAQAQISFDVRLPSGLPAQYHLTDVCYIAGSQAVSLHYAETHGEHSLPVLTITEQGKTFDERVGPRAEIHHTTAGDLSLEYVYGGWMSVPGTERAQWDDHMVPRLTLRFRTGNLYIQLGYTGDCREEDGACLSLTQFIALAGSLDG